MPPLQVASSFQLEVMELVVSILEQMLLHHDYGARGSLPG